MKKFMEKKEEARKEVYRKLEYLGKWENCDWTMSKLIAQEEKGKLNLEKMIKILNQNECCGCSSCCY